MKLFFTLLVSLLIISCAENDAKLIAEEYCNCRQIEMNQGALQGNKCFEDWDKKYGDVRLNEEQQNTFLEITKTCNPKSK